MNTLCTKAHFASIELPTTTNYPHEKQHKSLLLKPQHEYQWHTTPIACHKHRKFFLTDSGLGSWACCCCCCWGWGACCCGWGACCWGWDACCWCCWPNWLGLKNWNNTIDTKYKFINTRYITKPLYLSLSLHSSAICSINNIIFYCTPICPFTQWSLTKTSKLGCTNVLHSRVYTCHVTQEKPHL